MLCRLIPIIFLGRPLFGYAAVLISKQPLAAVTEEEDKQIEEVYLMPEALWEDARQHWEGMGPVEIVNRPAEDSYFRKVLQPEDMNTSMMSMRLELEGTRGGGVCVTPPWTNCDYNHSP